MKTLIRTAVIASAAASALALAAPALGAYTPKFDVAVPNALAATGTTTFHFAAVLPGTGTQETTARIVAYTAAGFTVNPGTAGSTIGEVEARVRAGDLGGAIIPVTGTLEVRDASGTVLVGGVPVPIATLAVACTGTATHTAFWVAKLSAAGQNLELLLIHDTTAGPEAAIGPSKLTICLPPDDVPVGTPGRSPLGIKLVDAILEFKNVFTNPSSVGAYVWVSVWTPYNPGVGTANAAGTVEARSINPLPVTLGLAGKYDKKRKAARLTGSFKLAGASAAGLRLPLFVGKTAKALKRAGSTGATNSAGAFTVVRRILATTFFQVRFAIPAVDFTSEGCVAPFIAPAGCVSATVGPISITSRTVKVTVPKKK